MDGKPYEARRFAKELRIRLLKVHTNIIRLKLNLNSTGTPRFFQ